MELADSLSENGLRRGARRGGFGACEAPFDKLAVGVPCDEGALTRGLMIIKLVVRALFFLPLLPNSSPGFFPDVRFSCGRAGCKP